MSRFRLQSIVAGALGAVLVSSQLALAAPVGYSTTPLDTFNVKGTVYASVVVGDNVYVGGNFTKVRHKGVDYPYQHLAAFDLATGALVTGFQPNPSSEVRALDVHGSSLFVGGKFISIGGQWRTRVAKIDVTTGLADATFNASASARVDAIETDGSRVFLGGSFTTVSGAVRAKLAAVDAVTGAIDPWNPGAGSGSVAALKLSPDATVVYVGGGFNTIAGSNRTKLAAISTTSGAVVGNDFSGASENVRSLDVSATGSVLYAGDDGNDLEAYDVASGARNWRNTIPQGDVQATHVATDGNVYIGFHDGADGMTNARVAAIDSATGVAVSWNPTFSSTYGVFAISSTSERLVIGGEFWNVSGVAQDGIAVFPLA